MKALSNLLVAEFHLLLSPSFSQSRENLGGGRGLALGTSHTPHPPLHHPLARTTTASRSCGAKGGEKARRAVRAQTPIPPSPPRPAVPTLPPELSTEDWSHVRTLRTSSASHAAPLAASCFSRTLGAHEEGPGLTQRVAPPPAASLGGGGGDGGWGGRAAPADSLSHRVRLREGPENGGRAAAVLPALVPAVSRRSPGRGQPQALSHKDI